MDDKLREEILANAHEILNDETLLRALIKASDKNLGNKITREFSQSTFEKNKYKIKTKSEKFSKLEAA